MHPGFLRVQLPSIIMLQGRLKTCTMRKENLLNTKSLAELRHESQAQWNTKAGFWDDYVGEAGNDFHRVLIAPTAEQLLALQPGEHVLDIGCGNGQFSRQIARLRAHVLSTDFSHVFLERAQKHAADLPPEIAARLTHQLVDATDEAQLVALGTQRFDAAVANMALMDMPTIEPLMVALTKLLKPKGRFVFSIMHPCFNNPAGDARVIEAVDREGEVTFTYAIKISKYLTPTVQKGAGIIGEPAPHYYFHRPLHMLLKSAFQAGFVLDALEEPTFAGDGEPTRPWSLANFKELPPALVVRLRLP